MPVGDEAHRYGMNIAHGVAWTLNRAIAQLTTHGIHSVIFHLVIPGAGTNPLSENLTSPLGEAPLVIIGWREWVSLPELNIPHIKAKIDTGARSSSLHAFEIEPFDKSGLRWVRFQVHPVQRRDDISVACEAPVHDVRSVRSSSGLAADRIVIQTAVSWMGETWTVDLTLADRTEMGFRMLVGREAVRGRMLVDPSRSFFGGRPPRRRRKHGKS